MKKLHLNAITTGICLLAALTLMATAADGTLSGNFGTDNDGYAGFTLKEPKGTWSLTDDALRFVQTSSSGSFEVFSAITGDPGIAGEDFQISTTVTMDRVTEDPFGVIGFGFLGATDDFSGTDFYGAVFLPAQGDHGQLRFRSGFSGGISGATLSRTSGSVAPGTELTFSLTGAYQGNGDLTVTLSVTDSAGGADDVLTHTFTNPLAGSYFGVGGRDGSTSSNSATTDFHNFTVIPEAYPPDVLVDWDFSTVNDPVTTANNDAFTGVASSTATLESNLSVSNLTTASSSGHNGLVWSGGNVGPGKLNLQRWDHPDDDPALFGVGNGNPNNWLVFNLNADPGYEFELEKMTVSAWRNGGGAPANWGYEYSTDNGDTWTAFGDTHNESNVGDEIFRLAEFTDTVSGSDLLIRLTAVGPEGGTGNIHIESMTVEGRVVPESPPESFAATINHSNGSSVTVDFEHHSVRAPNYQVKLHESDGSFVDHIAPESRTYLGSVQGYPGAIAAGLLKADGTLVSRVIFENGSHWFSTGGAASSGGTGGVTPAWPGLELWSNPTRGELYSVNLAVDASFKYRQLFGNITDTIEMMEFSVMVTNAIYLRDLGLFHRISDLMIRVRSATCPYESTDSTSALTGRLRDQWKHGGILTSNEKTGTHGIVAGTKPGINGGVATGTVGWSTAISFNNAQSHGDFSLLWRHEAGHNWGSPHYPGGGQPEGPTIMSQNAKSRFSSPEIYRMLVTRNDQIDLLSYMGDSYHYSLPPRANMTTAYFNVDVGRNIDPLDNDYDVNGGSLSFYWFEPTSALGGSVTLSPGTGPGGRDELYYDPPAGLSSGTDHFTYRIVDSSGRTSTNWVMLRPIEPEPNSVDDTGETAVSTDGDPDEPGCSWVDAKPAGDGISNLMKYAMDIDPMTSVASDDLFTTSVIDGVFVMSYFERTDVDDIDYIIEVSQDLIEWNSGPEYVEEVGNRIPVDGVDNLEKVTVRALLPEEATRAYMRLMIGLK